MSQGFRWAGYEISLGIEVDEHAWRTHCYNFDSRCYHGRIEDIVDSGSFLLEHGLLDVDVIIGGPPCQGFSRVGRITLLLKPRFLSR